MEERKINIVGQTTEGEKVVSSAEGKGPHVVCAAVDAAKVFFSGKAVHIEEKGRPATQTGIEQGR